MPPPPPPSAAESSGVSYGGARQARRRRAEQDESMVILTVAPVAATATAAASAGPTTTTAEGRGPQTLLLDTPAPTQTPAPGAATPPPSLYDVERISASASPQPTPEAVSVDMSRAIDAAIVAGVLGLVAVLLAVGFCFHRRRRRSQQRFARLADEKRGLVDKALPQTPAAGEDRAQSAMMDDIMRAVYEDETLTRGSTPTERYISHPALGRAASQRSRVSQWPARPAEARLVPLRASIYPPGQVPLYGLRVPSMALTDRTDATDSSWRTWQVDQSRPTRTKSRMRAMFQ